MNFRNIVQNGSMKITELFVRLAETPSGPAKVRDRLFADLKTELELHMNFEEQHLFPILRKNAETRELVVDAIRDNKELRAKLTELDGMPKNDPSFNERLAGLQKAFRQHARDEKNELLPAVQRALNEEQAQEAERTAAGIAAAEQGRQDEERLAKARQDREAAELLARQAEARIQRTAAAERAVIAADQRVRADARRATDTALKPIVAANQAAAADGAAIVRRQAQAQTAALTNMFMWPWLGAMQTLQQPASVPVARGPSGVEEIIPLGEEILEVGKRTENRGTVRIHRFVVETPVERQVTLQREEVVVERRRPVSDRVTGEMLTEVTVEVVETDEVLTVSKRMRLREEVVVRTERTQRVETVTDTVRHDEVEIQQAGLEQGNRQLRAVTTQR